MEILHGLTAKRNFVFIHFIYPDIKAQLTHGSNIDFEFQRLVSPGSNMGGHTLGREEMRKTPLNENTFQGIGVVARPKFCEIFQSFVVGTPATTGTQHHR